MTTLESPANPLADPQLTDYLRWFQQSLDLLPGQLKVIGFLALMGSNAPPLLLHLLQNSHLHRQSELKCRHQ